LKDALVAASSNTADARLAIDGRLDTAWSTERSQAPGDWFDVVLKEPIRLGRVELLLGPKSKWKGEALRLSVSEDGGQWRAIASAQGRAPVDEQPRTGDGMASQVLLAEGVLVRGVSVRQIADGNRRWGFAEIRIDELLADSPE
ncbi:MAG: discoidin domain-containing protein, partial [Vicinamibacteria bacterium]